MANTMTWCSVRVTFVCLLLGMLLFSFVTLDFEHRVMTVKYDFTIANEDASPKGLMTAFSGFVRQKEKQPILPSSDKDNSLTCQIIKGKSESPFQRVWERMKPSIMNVSLLNTTWAKNIRAMKNFTDWVDESMSYFTYSRLQHTSLSRPIDQTRSIGQIRSVLEEKMRNPTTAPPLRIVVFGGSVTNGHCCLENIFNFLVRTDGKGNDRAGSPAPQSRICAWSGRLQDMMDVTFGDGVVEIINLASGGAKSDSSTALMEFGLIPGSTPDIIFWDHGINDAMTSINPNLKYFESTSLNSDQIFDKLQKFYQAAITLPTTCDKPEPPLVIMLDTFIGQQRRFSQISEAMRISPAISKMLSWYPTIWGISFANTVRPYILTHVTEFDQMIGLLGIQSVDTHPGMMYHISVAWVVMFNFLNALHDDCISNDISATNDLFSERSERLNPSNESDYLPLPYLPELNVELQMVDVPKVWNERMPEPIDYETCLEKQTAKEESTKMFTKDSSLTCFYAWIINSVFLPQAVNRKIKPYLVANEGWSAFGTDPNESPYGWIPPGGRGSFFQMEFSSVPTTVESLTLIYMQSYSQNWINSTLQVDCTFYNPSEKANTPIESDVLRFLDRNDTPDMIQRTETYTTISYLISGYHEEETSILVPIKLQLPNRTLDDVRSTLRLHFRLIDGEAFKIAGIALC